MTTVGYNTVNQRVHWGGPATATKDIVDLGPDMSGLEIQPEVRRLNRVVLGADYPTQDVALVSYRFSIPRLRIGAASEFVRLNPQETLVLVRTDDLQCMVVSSAVAAGIPLQAQRDGEITSGVNISPFGLVYKGTAAPFTSGTDSIKVAASKPIYASVLAGNGRITWGSTNLNVPNPGIFFFAGLDQATTVTVPSAFNNGFLLHSLELATP